MRLKALDQIHVSAVQADSLRPNQIFEISDAAGADLLKKHPKLFVLVKDGAKAEGAAPKNKMEGNPLNKDAEKPDYAAQRVADLKALAEKRGVDISAAKNKGEVITALEAADEAARKAAEDQA